MKTVIGVLGLSILSAIVGVFAAAELHEISGETESSTAVFGAHTTGPAQPSQRIQQWVNH